MITGAPWSLCGLAQGDVTFRVSNLAAKEHGAPAQPVGLLPCPSVARLCAQVFLQACSWAFYVLLSVLGKRDVPVTTCPGDVGVHDTHQRLGFMFELRHFLNSLPVALGFRLVFLGFQGRGLGVCKYRRLALSVQAGGRGSGWVRSETCAAHLRPPRLLAPIWGSEGCSRIL